MKRFLSVSALCLSLALLLAGCDKKGTDPVEKFNSKPITAAAVSGATVTVNQTQKEIAVSYDAPPADLTEVSVTLTLADGVTMVSPATNPFTVDLSGGASKEITVRSAGKDVTYKIKALVDIDLSEPFTDFEAKAENTEATVMVDHIERTIQIAFDAAQLNLEGVAVDYTLAADVTVVSPEGKSWNLSTTAPLEFKLEKFGEEVTYTVTTTVSVDLSEPVTAFSAKVGEETADVAINHEARTISVVFNNGSDFTAVEVAYTLAPNVTADQAAGDWDLSTATKEAPFEFKLHKGGADVTYKVYLTKFFTPSFRDENGEPATVPFDWERITDNISPDIAFYKVTSWGDNSGFVGYAIAAKVADVEFKTIGEGYGDKMKSVTAHAATVPNANIVISGGDSPNLLIVDGKIVNNTVNNDSDTCILLDAAGGLHKLGVTNRVDGEGNPCSLGTAGEKYGDKIFGWDSKQELPDIVSAGAIGSGVLNWGARELTNDKGELLFPNGILHDINKTEPRAEMVYGATGGVLYFFVCEKSARSGGITTRGALEIIRNMGCGDGGIGTYANRNTIGLVVNGESLINVADGEHTATGYAFVLSGK